MPKATVKFKGHSVESLRSPWGLLLSFGLWGIVGGIVGGSFKLALAGSAPSTNLSASANNLNASNPDAQFSLGVHYGAHSEFWDELELLRSDLNAAQKLSEILERDLRFAEGFVHARLIHQAQDCVWGCLWNRVYFSLGWDSLAGGRVQNPVLPELQGYALWMVPIETGVWFQGKQLSWGLGSLAGLGRQTLYQGLASAYLTDAWEEHASVFALGAGAFVEWQNEFASTLWFRTRYQIRVLHFYTHLDNPRFDYRAESDNWIWRWREQSEVMRRWKTDSAGTWAWGADLIFGAQPLPYEILPVVWDAVHDVYAFPEFAAMVGLGAIAQWTSPEEDVGLEIRSGYYAGYFGIGGALRLWKISLGLGSFGVEQSSAYRVQESRLNYLQGGYHARW